MDNGINRRVEEYRKKAGLTQKDVAINLGLKTQNYQQKESKGNIPVEMLKELAKMFEIPITYLIYSEEELKENGLHTVPDNSPLIDRINNISENSQSQPLQLNAPKMNPYTIGVNRREKSMFSMYQSLSQRKKEAVYEFIKEKFYEK